METVLRRMLRCPADAYKIVTTARKPSDVYRVLALAKAHAKAQVIVLAMGEIGFPSRVLSSRFGGLFTYAAPSTAEGTAAGQVSAKVLRHLYRMEKLSRAGKVYGVIADPVRHSISPAVHNRAFQARRIDAVYLPFLTPSLHLKDFMTLAEKLPIMGFSVTIPHKQKIIRYLDVVDPLARRIGAVNTVWRKAGKWRGMNTDAEAVTVRHYGQVCNLAKSTVLVVGSGGAARAASFALVDAGAKVSISGRMRIARVPPRSPRPVARPHPPGSSSSLHFDALVHATPAGHVSARERVLLPGRHPCRGDLDMVYNPIETLLLRRAREQGKTLVPGLQMFLEQAARQFEIWTGDSAPRSAMEKAALEALGAARL